MRDWHLDIDTNFVKACLGEEELLVTAGQGAYIQKLICALYESARTGRSVVFIPASEYKQQVGDNL